MKLFLLTSLTMIAFAANSVINRAALAHGAIDPITFAVLRLWFGVVVLAAFMVWQAGGRTLKPEVNIIGTLGLTAYMLGFSLAYVSMDAGLGALVLFGGVQVTMFAGVLLRGQRPSAMKWLGAVVAMFGLAYLLWPSEAVQQPVEAMVCMLLAALGWGMYSLVGQRSRNPINASCTSFALSALMGLGIWVVFADAIVTPAGLSLAALSGAITSGLFYPLWYWVLPQLKTTTAAVAQLSVPLIAAVGGLAFLAEALTLRLLVSAALILGGIALTVATKR